MLPIAKGSKHRDNNYNIKLKACLKSDPEVCKIGAPSQVILRDCASHTYGPTFDVFSVPTGMTSSSKPLVFNSTDPYCSDKIKDYNIEFISKKDISFIKITENGRKFHLEKTEK